ncbi:MAG: hypothetical protein Q8O25_06845 [Sulfurisoma sp.]|nr:hypothetical protein [Sulfurisoma sp.]
MPGTACFLGRDDYIVVGLVPGDGDLFANDGAFNDLVLMLFFIDASASLDVFIAGSVDPIRRGDVVLNLLGKLIFLLAAEDGQIVEELRFLIVSARIAGFNLLIALRIWRFLGHDRSPGYIFSYVHPSGLSAMPLDSHWL